MRKYEGWRLLGWAILAVILFDLFFMWFLPTFNPFSNKVTAGILGVAAIWWGLVSPWRNKRKANRVE